ncbi:MAG TPA: PAS domain-containing protein [Nitrospirales bacterium]|nr:PAS domain-containing protein [Nitrospirales bacterium]
MSRSFSSSTRSRFFSNPQREYTSLEWTLEGESGWLRNFAVARMGVLSFITVGSAFLSIERGAEYLLFLYTFGFLTNYWYLHTLHAKQQVGSSQTWAQVVVDFSVVALTVALTDGPTSFFTFIFVVVVLEVGVLLGLRQGFVIATLASVFMLEQTLLHPSQDRFSSTFNLWYNYLVQVMLIYLTAFISGYWNNRIYKLREFQSEILDNMASGFIITNARGMIAAQNVSASRILSIPSEESMGRSIGEIMHTASGDECPVLTALRSGKDYNSYEFQLQQPQGSTTLLGLTTNHMYNDESELTGLIVSFTDLTEMNAMRQELLRQDRMAVVGELAVGLAHEIRNPVAVIRGAVDEMRSSSQSQELIERLQAMALRESDHLNEIVKGFLDFSTNPSEDVKPLELSGIIDDVATLLRREYDQHKALQIECSIPDEAYWISGNASQLKQVFVNIGKNAVEAMDFAGTLLIQASQIDDGPVQIRFDDTGPGIEPGTIEKIFEPFFTMKDSGVGMGLAVCMRIITAHNGTIRASNRAGGGCALELRLPRLRHEAKGSKNES